MLLLILIMLPLFGILVLFILNRSNNVGLDEQENLLKQTNHRDALIKRLATGRYDKNIPSFSLLDILLKITNERDALIKRIVLGHYDNFIPPLNYLIHTME